MQKITPFMRQCFVTASVCCSTIGNGGMLGFSSILLAQLQAPGSSITVTTNQATWIASGISWAIMSLYITPPITGRWGRRIAHMVCCTVSITSWLLTILSTSFETLLAARMVQGVSLGMLGSLRSVILGEYTSPKNRGAFLTTISLSQGFGIFLVHLIGTFLSWQKTALVFAFFSYASLLITIYTPESPSWLAEHGRYDECRVAFKWLRGDEADDELEDMIESRILIEMYKIGQKRTKNRWQNLITIIKQREFYKPITLMIHANLMIQFSGSPVIAAYATIVLELLMGPGVNVYFWMIFLDLQRIISNTAAVFVINKVKRRTVMFSTGALCVVSNLAIAGYVYAKNLGILPFESIWLPALLINLQMFSVATGVMPIPSVIAGEVFPVDYRSIGNSTAFLFAGVGQFLVLKTFLLLIEQFGLHGTSLLFSSFLVYCLTVIWFLLPETKGKTLQQIEDEFRGRPLTLEEREVRMSLQVDPVQAYKTKSSDRKQSGTFPIH